MVFQNDTFPHRKGIFNCKREALLSRCPIHVYSSVHCEGCDEAGDVRRSTQLQLVQPQAVPDSIRAEQPLHSASLGWRGRRSAAAPQRSRRFHCCHLSHLCAKQLSGQNRRRPLLPITLSQREHSDACNRVYKEHALWYYLFRNCE